MELILNYFPDITEKQKQQYEMLLPVYADWNAKINLISRKDFEHFYERHVLHSLAIARFVSFKSGSTVIDIGTGGGFPGVPLAIMFPDVHFILVDSIAKKIKVVNEVSSSLGLQNLEAINQRAEQLLVKGDFIVSRATAPLTELVNWTNHLLDKRVKGNKLSNNGVPENGWITLKGGDLEEELKPFAKKVRVIAVSEYFSEDFFDTKKLVYLPKE